MAGSDDSPPSALLFPQQVDQSTIVDAVSLKGSPFGSQVSPSRDRIVVSTLRCGRSNPGSNPGHGTFLFHIFFCFAYPQGTVSLEKCQIDLWPSVVQASANGAIAVIGREGEAKARAAW